MSGRAGEASCSVDLRYFLKISLSFPALLLETKSTRLLQGQHGVRELRVTWLLVARLESCGSGLVSCCQAGCMPLCQLCPREGFNLGLFCCYPSCSWSLRELNYLWEVFSVCQVWWELTDRFNIMRGTGNAIAPYFHMKSGKQKTRDFSFSLCDNWHGQHFSHAKIGDLRHYSFSPTNCWDLMISL